MLTSYLVALLTASFAALCGYVLIYTVSHFDPPEGSSKH